MKKFSIIIPIAPERSALVLASLNELDYPKKDYEVIIEKGYNTSENRNKGISKSKGKILYFVDDDAIVDKTILKKAEQFFENTKIDVVGGPQLTPADDKYFAKASGYVMSSFLATHKMSNRYKKGKLNLNADESYLTSANLFIKKEVFNSTAGFNPKLWPGEDPELIARLKSLGFKIAYSPDLIIYHKRRQSFIPLFKQFFNYGKVSVQKEKTKSTEISLLFFIPTLFLLYLISLPFLYKINMFIILPLIIYLFLILLNSFYLSIKNKNILSLPLMPFIYFVIHISYGLGVLRSLLSKII